jgi:prophage regulatory protein
MSPYGQPKNRAQEAMVPELPGRTSFIWKGTAIMVGQSILRRKQVELRTGLSRTGIYEKLASGEFPQPIKLGARAVGWLESEINGWIECRIVASRKPVSL